MTSFIASYFVAMATDKVVGYMGSITICSFDRCHVKLELFTLLNMGVSNFLAQGATNFFI
jgi:hypothetical protein